MASKQNPFLHQFKDAFMMQAPGTIWAGGQRKDNTAALLTHKAGRREGKYHQGERFELGDLSCMYGGYKIIIEYESKQVSISNLLKYWPYLRGELSTRPNTPVIICHFSNWESYGIYRDLWEWTLDQMKRDTGCAQVIIGKQFDHGGDNNNQCLQAISEAIVWIQNQVTHNSTLRLLAE